MKKKGFLVSLIVLLVAEAILIVLLPAAKIPRAVRALTAATNLIAAAVVWLAIRQGSRAAEGSGRGF